MTWALVFPDNNFMQVFISLWNEADEGGGRVTLATNGITAFFYSPIFGHGAGAFSGTDGVPAKSAVGQSSHT